jgi:hypothetical protein
MDTTSFPERSFSDVPPGTQFFGDISWIGSAGISSGYADGSYGPLQSVNRDAMAAFMYRLAGSPQYTPPAQSPFSDVTPQTQFYKEITWLASKGISTGWNESDGTKTFRPLQPVARDAMAAFMYRFTSNYQDLSSFAPPTNSWFTDMTPQTQFYREIMWLATNRISTGWVEPNRTATYRPLNTVARDAMAAFMQRTAGLINRS